MASPSPWYYPADAFRTVFAVGDLHADVGLAVRVFCDVLRVVALADDGGGWRWVGNPRVCIVVCGDVVDRARGPANVMGSAGENGEQDDVPDDLCVLRLLNLWSELAEAAGSRILRLLGNHDVWTYEGYFTDRARAKLEALESADVLLACRRPQWPLCVRALSFRRGLFAEALWHPSCRLVAQVGPMVFVHAGLTEEGLDHLAALGGPAAALAFVHRESARGDGGADATGAPELGALGQLLTTRNLAPTADPGAAEAAARLLERWTAALRPPERARYLVTAHNALVEPYLPVSARLLHFTRTSRFSVAARLWERLAPGPPHPHGPWIHAEATRRGPTVPVLFRIDAALSRAWRAPTESTEVGRPQVLMAVLEEEKKEGAVVVRFAALYGDTPEEEPRGGRLLLPSDATGLRRPADVLRLHR